MAAAIILIGFGLQVIVIGFWSGTRATFTICAWAAAFFVAGAIAAIATIRELKKL